MDPTLASTAGEAGAGAASAWAAFAEPEPFAALAALLLVAAWGLATLRPGFVVGRPRSVLAAMAVPTLLALAALVQLDPPGLRIRIDPSTELLLPAGDPGHARYQRAVRDFGDDEVYVIAMECDGGVFEARHLAALRRIGHEIARLPGVTGVASLVEVTSFRWVPEEAWIEVRPFVEDIPEDPAALADLRERALDNPLYRRTLVSEDGRTAALNVSFRKMDDATFIASGADEAIAAILAAAREPGRRFHVAGRPHVKARVYALMLRDLVALIPAGLLALAVVLYALAGTARGVALPLSTVVLATLWTFGAMAFLGRPLTVLTTLLAPVLIAVGSVYGVHVLAHWEEDRALHADPVAAAHACLVGVRLPVTIAGLTTVLGFAALGISDVPAVRELGALSVLGVASVTVLSLTFVPAWIALPARRERSARAVRLEAWLDAHLERLGAGVARRPGRALWAWAALTAVALALLPRIVVDTDFLSFFPRSAPVRRDFEAVNRLLAGAIPIYVTLEGENRGAFREPDTLAALDTLEARLGALEGASHAATFVDTLKRLNRAFAAGDPAAERVPDSRSGVMELLFMVPKGDLARFVNLDHSRANVVVRTGQEGSAATRALVARIEATLDATPLPHVAGHVVTGNSVLIARSADAVAEAQPRTIGAAALAIFAVVAWTFRSLGLGMLVMVPNLVPVAIFFGLLGAGIAPLSLPTSLIGSISLGIAIDGTVHFVVRHRRERAAGATSEQAVVTATRAVGRPIAIATAMLCVGFAVVAFSSFATLRQFGGLACVTMAICMASDLVLLPALLVRFRL
ncbi:MAG TPA: MMPL family transporter [Myxococcota bacterium]|nr:MMPL family transporter [Myxococcota bacterium]